MTAVKSYKRHTPDKEMMDHRQAWLLDDGEDKIRFRVYSRGGDTPHTVTINKSTLDTTCTCEYFTEWRRDDPSKSCWHMRKGMYSYLLRIQRGEVE